MPYSAHLQDGGFDSAHVSSSLESKKGGVLKETCATEMHRGAMEALGMRSFLF